MNWSRGLLRSWFFLSAAWIIAFGYMNFDDWHSWHHAHIQFENAPKFDPSKPYTEVPTPPPGFTLDVPYGARPFEYVSALSMTLGPPVVLLLIGAGLYWSISGFRRT
jgi:hypothetical protein